MKEKKALIESAIESTDLGLRFKEYAGEDLLWVAVVPNDEEPGISPAIEVTSAASSAASPSDVKVDAILRFPNRLASSCTTGFINFFLKEGGFEKLDAIEGCVIGYRNLAVDELPSKITQLNTIAIPAINGLCELSSNGSSNYEEQAVKALIDIQVGEHRKACSTFTYVEPLLDKKPSKRERKLQKIMKEAFPGGYLRVEERCCTVWEPSTCGVVHLVDDEDRRVLQASFKAKVDEESEAASLIEGANYRGAFSHSILCESISLRRQFVTKKELKKLGLTEIVPSMQRDLDIVIDFGTEC